MKEGKIFNCCMATAVALAVNFAPIFAFGACKYSHPDNYVVLRGCGYRSDMSGPCTAYKGTLTACSSFDLNGQTPYRCKNTCPSGKDTNECCCTREGGTWSGGRCLEMSTTVNYPSTNTDQAFTDYPSSGSDYPVTDTTTTTTTYPWTDTTTTATDTTTTYPWTDTTTTTTYPWTDTTTTATDTTTTYPWTDTTTPPDQGGGITTTPPDTTTTMPDTTTPEETSTFCNDAFQSKECCESPNFQGRWIEIPGGMP